jgi:hypothetical protein
MPLYSQQFTDDVFRIYGDTDTTKVIAFEADGLTTGTTRTLTPQDASYIIAGSNIPNIFGKLQTIVPDSDTVTLSLGAFTGGGTSNILEVLDEFSSPVIEVGPTGNISTTGTQNALGLLKVNTSTGTHFGDATTTTKKLYLDLSGATAAKSMTVKSYHTDNREVTIPNATTTLAGLAVAETWTGVQTFGSGAAVFGQAADDETLALFKSRYNSGVNANAFMDIGDTASTTSSGFKLTLELPTGGLTADRRASFPDATGQVVLTASTDTLTNKTLAAPGGIRCTTSTASGIKFQNGTSTTQIIMLDLSEITAQRNIKFINLAGTVLLAESVVMSADEPLSYDDELVYAA